MKFLKKAIATTMAFLMFASVSTVGFAMSDASNSKYELKYKVSDVYTSENKNLVDVSLYVVQTSGSDDLNTVEFQPDAYDTYGNSTTFKTTYNKSNVTFVSATSDYFTIADTDISHTAARGTVNIVVDYDDTLVLTADKALYKITYEVLQTEEGSYAIYSKAFSELTLMDSAANSIKGTTNCTLADATAIKYTIAAPVVDDEVTATQTAGTNNDTYAFENLEEGSKLAGQKVALRKTKVDGSAITENTRVKVTAGDRTQIYGGDLWETLNVEGAGELSAKTVTFGIMFSDESLTADSFTFEILN